MSAIDDAKAKIVINNLIELSYSMDKGATERILTRKGMATLSIDQDGTATLSETAGFVSFRGDSVLKEIGTKIKFISIHFNNRSGWGVGYEITFDFPGKIASFTLEGSFDLKELITSCSGMSCEAGRAIVKHRKDLKDVMENY